jgi:membrane associated rhomboid family serine protease
MATPTFKRVVRTVAWAVLGWLLVGVVAGIVLSALAIIDDGGGTSVAVTVAAFAGLIGGAIFGWKHELKPIRR